MAFKTFALLASVVAAKPLGTIHGHGCGTEEPHSGILALAAKVNAAKHNAAASVVRRDAFAAIVDVPVYVHVIASNETSDGGYLLASEVSDAISSMNGSYAGTGFQFKLVDTDYTIHALLADDETASDKDRLALRKKLRKGDYKTLNLYVHPETMNNSNGYCYFPTYATEDSDKFSRDGCTIRASKWTNQQTVPHETGHWLGLPHTFGKTCDVDGDGLDDTPRCLVTWSDDCAVIDTCPDHPGNDPVTNFMSYGYCRMDFTDGQISLMKASYNEYRA